MAMKVFAAAAVLNAADMNEYCVNTLYAFKPGDQQVVSSTTLVDDNDLQLTVAANKKYELKLFVNYFSTSATPGIKCQITYPAGATFYGQSEGYQVGDAFPSTGSWDAAATGRPASASVLHFGTNSITDLPLSFIGVLDMGGNSGTLKFRFAQDTSGGSPTIVRQGSNMILNRIS